jgi:hypothetical protein
LIYGSHERSFSNVGMTQQGKFICFVERRIGSWRLWFSKGSSLVHRRIVGSIQGVPWIASGSPWGAEGEHPWIVCLLKTIRNPIRYGYRVPLDVSKRNRLICTEVDQSELNYDLERSGVDRFGSDRGLGEPDAFRGDSYIGLWASEAIQFGC